jgi:hypothetical protein
VPDLPPRFATNDLPHFDPTGADHDRFDDVLPQALAAWMRGRDLDRPAHSWFGDPGSATAVAPTREPADRITRALVGLPDPAPGDRLVWLGGDVLVDGRTLVLHTPTGTAQVRGPRDAIDWLAEVLDAALPGKSPLRWEDARAAFPTDWERFAASWATVRQAGLVGV